MGGQNHLEACSLTGLAAVGWGTHMGFLMWLGLPPEQVTSGVVWLPAQSPGDPKANKAESV